MRPLLILLTICFLNKGYSQTSQIHDNTLNDICTFIDTSKLQNDSIRVSQAFEKHLFPLLRDMDSAKAIDAWNYVFFRLQHTCTVFESILNRHSPIKGDWKTFDGEPVSLIDKSGCEKFKQIQAFSYLETTGDSVHVTFNDGFWIDRFKDGTFSKLKFTWLNKCSFVIEFIESNNLARKNFSKPGDQYFYEVLNKGDRYYDMAVTISGKKQYSTFKLYY